jgi:hypothetical protein
MFFILSPELKIMILHRKSARERTSGMWDRTVLPCVELHSLAEFLVCALTTTSI